MHIFKKDFKEEIDRREVELEATWAETTEWDALGYDGGTQCVIQRGIKIKRLKTQTSSDGRLHSSLEFRTYCLISLIIK